MLPRPMCAGFLCIFILIVLAAVIVYARGTSQKMSKVMGTCSFDCARSSMVVVVNSFSESLGLDRALRTINVPKARLIVVVGDSDCNGDYQIEQTETHLEVLVKHNSVDFTGLIAILDHYDEIQSLIGNFDALLYVHDTCSFEKSFYQKVSCLAKTFEHRTVRLRVSPGMNMGFYNVRDLESISVELHAKRSTDRPGLEERLASKVKRIIDEDCIFNWLHISEVLVDASDPHQFTVDWTPRDVYKNGAARIAEHFKFLGITKYKANYQGPHAQVHLL